MGIPIGTTLTTQDYGTKLKKEQKDETTTNVNSAPVDSTAATDSGVPCVESSAVAPEVPDGVAPTSSGVGGASTTKETPQTETAMPTAQAPNNNNQRIIQLQNSINKYRGYIKDYCNEIDKQHQELEKLDNECRKLYPTGINENDVLSGKYTLDQYKDYKNRLNEMNEVVKEKENLEFQIVNDTRAIHGWEKEIENLQKTTIQPTKTPPMEPEEYSSPGFYSSDEGGVAE